MGKKTESPLMDIAMQMVTDANQALTEEELRAVKDTLKKYIQNEISLEYASDIMSPILVNLDPLHRVDNILHVVETPLDEYSLEEEKLAGRRRSHSWSIAEDNRLIYAIHHGGFGDWSRVASFVGNGRTRSQCSQRWHRTLDPRINKQNWTTSDDNKLLEAVSKFGVNTWTKVAKFVGSRTDVQCRYRYMLIKKHGKTLGRMRSSLKSSYEKRSNRGSRNRSARMDISSDDLSSYTSYSEDEYQENDSTYYYKVDQTYTPKYTRNTDINSNESHAPIKNVDEQTKQFPALTRTEEQEINSLFNSSLGSDEMDSVWKTLFETNDSFDFNMDIEVI
ncbi:Myb-like DNA-binding domain containing protein [Trichomonas vaginalis G3]|uniref:Myb-like DNA-binding domain containing protein n=1 Tax=Trichomonas vaginalis (strain ATCC PRA-98 / G3) TaxID=412133 RepID=A2G424_TRIV3|nr:RNA polymerase II transcription regulator recruiting protein [Trichomonas vaginalis G3]EAX88089.1 Myb-like DNA-binding domain containing protein [Trichomonas vaginalis G3]KAI5495742.1 RNA polymerase II transcription regulator recruiting protein [Trichomonas vaginalis G3]|eukprot:XP_001301019.1 Myb-like DNA-binding domain containing protein [Trichomonas vaginalis G3]